MAENWNRIGISLRAYVEGVDSILAMNDALTKIDMQHKQMIATNSKTLAADKARMQMEQEQASYSIALDKQMQDGRMFRWRAEEEMASEMSKRKIDALKMQNMALKENSQLATQNLGYNLGMLFGIMGVAGAIKSTTSDLVKYNIVSEKTGKILQAGTDSINVLSKWMTAYISIMMLVQSVEARRAQAQINNNNRLIMSQMQLNSATGAGVGIGAAGIGVAGAGGAAAGMAAALPYVGVILAALGIGLAGYSIYKSTKHQYGTDEIVSSPRMVMVGENGPERLNVTPMGTRGRGGGGDIIINVSGNIYGDKAFKSQMAQAIREAQRGSA